MVSTHNNQLLKKGGMKAIAKKKSRKHDREHRVLLALVSHYLKTGKPVGSNTLKEAEFADLSSATLRNYFSHLEEEGYLIQQHTSGGRIPTDLAFRVFAQEYLDSTEKVNQEEFQHLRHNDTREIAAYLQEAAETLSRLTQTAVFLSAPRFDQDYIVDLKLVAIDHSRCLCVIITGFGVIRTEQLHIDTKLSAFAVKRIEAYFHWRLTGHGKPENCDEDEEQLAQKIYNELMIRYIVGYSNFIDAELYRTGFSKLLSYPEFHEASALASSLALFENAHSMRSLVKECCKISRLKFWIGDDLLPYAESTPNCAVVAIPYYINYNIVGAIGLLGPTRMPYPEIFRMMRSFATCVSEALTRNVYKFKITFRQPHTGTYALQNEEYRLIDQSSLMLLETDRLKS